MGIRETIFGWLRSTPGKRDELEDVEADEAAREYSSDKADLIAEERFGMRSSEFEDDQDRPRH